MKTSIVSTLALLIFLSVPLVFAQDKEDTEDTNNQKVITTADPNRPIPTGMEEIQLGGSAKLIVPEGAKTRKVGAQIIVEGTKEYVARRFSEMETRLADLEKRQEELEKKVDALQKRLDEAKTIKTINSFGN